MQILIDGVTFTGKQMLGMVLKSLAIAGLYILYLSIFVWSDGGS